MACLEHVRKEWVATQDGGHDTIVLNGLEILDARPGYVLTRLKIGKHNLNNHGLVDSVTWLALTALGAPVLDSVSTNMSQEFVRPCGQLGDYLYAEGEAVQQGRRLAFTRVTFKVNGKICGFGSHTMAVTPKQLTHKFSADGKERIPASQADDKAKL